jgi:predicted TIM-barrel fold metal-dependent hydrolase
MVFYVKGTIDPEYLLEMVRKVGAERTVLGSDLGQIGNPSPIEGIRKCIEIMLNLGITDEEIDLMIRKNPAKLLNLD